MSLVLVTLIMTDIDDDDYILIIMMMAMTMMKNTRATLTHIGVRWIRSRRTCRRRQLLLQTASLATCL